MCSRLNVRSGQQPAAVRKQLDGMLAVRAWSVPGLDTNTDFAPPDESVPWWWDGDEEASESFLAAMGVRLGD